MCRASSLNRASSLDRTGVCGRTNFSGDRVGETFGLLFPSIIKLRSLTEEGCIDCMRRCEPPFMRDGTRALSRARSLSAACADWMALEVPAREVKPFGDCGLRGRGGGQRSGSELSHLLLVSRRKQGIVMMGRDAHWYQGPEAKVRRDGLLVSQRVFILSKLSRGVSFQRLHVWVWM